MTHPNFKAAVMAMIDTVDDTGFDSQSVEFWEAALLAALQKLDAPSPNPLPTTEGVTQADFGQQIVDDMIYAAAQSLDYPSVYMGGPSQASMRRAKMCIKAALEAAANRPLPPPPGQ